MVAVLEEARALGELLKQGWKPKRTIIYCAWDGEEPGLLGSTEWAEDARRRTARTRRRLRQLRQQGRGYFGVEAPRAREIHQRCRARNHGSGKEDSVCEARTSARNRGSEDATSSEKSASARISDWRAGLTVPTTRPFQHSWIASLNIGYGDEDDGIYHSIYDDFYWYTHFADQDFVYGRATGPNRWLNCPPHCRFRPPSLPLRSSKLRPSLKYESELEKLYVKKTGRNHSNKTRKFKEGAFTATADPTKPCVPPPADRFRPT